MQDQTPEMERIDAQLRELMRRWVREPANAELKERFNSLQHQYQRLLLEQKRSSDGLA